MYTNLQLAKKYVQYYWNAHNSKGHGMHSPFVFDFILSVLNNRYGYTPPAIISALHKTLLHHPKEIVVEDLGAGSRTGFSQNRKIKELARSAVKPEKYRQLLYRLVKHYRPNLIIELGTSLGVTTSYLSAGHPDAKVITIEGSENIHQLAKENFQKLEMTRIEALKGNFDVVLPEVLKKVPGVDLGYIDGNHRYEPTLDYFNQLLEKSGNHTILVFDDIHWSPGMEAAWEKIKEHPSVRCTIDLFFLGFVFFRKEFKEKQHFTIRF